MANSRYNKIEFLNDIKEYKELFPKRSGKDGIRQIDAHNLEYPTLEEETQFQVVEKVWTSSDRLYKLAFQYYGESQYWWVIAFYNKKPTENHIKIGDKIKVPLPLDSVLTAYGL